MSGRTPRCSAPTSGATGSTEARLEVRPTGRYPERHYRSVDCQRDGDPVRRPSPTSRVGAIAVSTSAMERAMRRRGAVVAAHVPGDRESRATLRRRVFQTCRPNAPGQSGRPDQMGSRGVGFGRIQEAMCFSKVLRTLSSRGSTSVACPTRVTEATLSPAWLRSTLAKASCDP